MTNRATNASLTRALTISYEMLAAAEAANMQCLPVLDAERMLLLKSFRLEVKQVDADDRGLLLQISHLNDRTLGLLEHHRRSKGREMDMAVAGRRAVAAYSSVRLQR
jgi:hypothetical protein